MNPKITVIVPYHNEQESIEFTLDQVGMQTLPADTAIFVNSSSTDHTSDVIERWIEKNQHRFETKFLNRFENTDNPASSKNVGIRHATTEWVAFMDCGQHFQRDWLENQAAYVEKNNADVVSGVVYLVGENWVDRCAVAQTYGYKRLRPCIPTTLLKSTIFEKTGLFLEGRRSGYDIAWVIKLKRMGIRRCINQDVQIKYIGINFASNLTQLFAKSVLYGKPSVSIEGYVTPYFYIFIFLLILVTFALSIQLVLAVILFCFLARTFFLPILKSQNLSFFREHPFEAIFGLGLVGLTMDLGKFIGILQGIYFYSRVARSRR